MLKRNKISTLILRVYQVILANYSNIILDLNKNENLPNCSICNNRHCFSLDRKSTRLNSSHITISYAVFCLKKKKQRQYEQPKTDPTGTNNQPNRIQKQQ